MLFGPKFCASQSQIVFLPLVALKQTFSLAKVCYFRLSKGMFGQDMIANFPDGLKYFIHK
jgi:hypothetical protein